MKKPHITCQKTFVIRHGKQKLELTKAEAEEFFNQLADLLGYATLPKKMLEGLFEKAHDEADKRWPVPNRLPDPLIIYGDNQPCLFDGLPPGVYGLVCSCPKCSPRCVSESGYTSVSTGNVPVVFS